jgi:hypothetical protein
MCLSPDERTRFLREISGSVKTVRCEKDLTVGFTWGISYRGLGVGNPDITTIGVTKSRNAISRRPKESCGGHRIREVDRWHAVSGFHGEKSRKVMHLGFTILRTPKCRWSEGPLNSQSRECIGETTYRGSW